MKEAALRSSYPRQMLRLLTSFTTKRDPECQTTQEDSPSGLGAHALHSHADERMPSLRGESDA